MSYTLEILMIVQRFIALTCFGVLFCMQAAAQSSNSSPKALNPQPIPPGKSLAQKTSPKALNPQPIPPGKHHKKQKTKPKLGD